MGGKQQHRADVQIRENQDYAGRRPVHLDLAGGGTSPSFIYNYDTLAELEAATLTEVDDIYGQYMERTLHR
jgi:hypothetical protein